MSKILNFLTSRKDKAVKPPVSVDSAHAAPLPTRCFCGALSCEAVNRTDAYNSELHDVRGFCADCLESFGCWLTSRKIVYLQRTAA